MFDRFTDNAKKCMNLARQEAQRLHHEYLGTEHLLLGVIRVGDCAATGLLRRRGVDLDRVRLEVEKLVRSGPAAPAAQQLPFTPGAKKVLEHSMGEAANLGHNYIGTEHVLLGLIKQGEGIAAKALSAFDVRLEDVREDARAGNLARSNEHEQGRPAGGPPVRGPSAGHPASSAPSYLGNDLTALAERGALEPLIGRDAELERLIQVLCRKDHPNAVVIGRSGTGKTALVHGLACAIAAGRVPELGKKRLVELHLGQAIVGSFEERWRAVNDEAKRLGDFVFVLDDLTVLLPSGPNRRGDRVDAERMLRFVLAGPTPCIAVTTPVLWSELVEPHEALARRLQPVHLPAATRAETHAILRGLQERYERHHQVRWTEEALDAALDLASAQLPGFPLPGIAIDVLDDASAAVKLASRPAASDAAVLALKIEALERAKRRALEAQELQRAAQLHEEANQHRAKLTASQDRANRPELWALVTPEYVARAVAARVAR
ncbi:MAG: AAA family ATPase [Planctomycetaceae bacterium]|nr:AAA family ATPase [Planctomycetaceae bacterium]